MENNDFSKKIMLTYGLYLGFATVFVAVVNFAFGNIYKPHWSISLLNFLLSVLFIVLGIKSFKALNNGFLKLGEAIKVGLGISLISGLISIIYYFILTKVIEPNYQENMRGYLEKMYMEQFPDMDEAMIDSAVNMATKFTSPVMMIAFIIIFSLFLGLIISLIAGAIMKKEEQMY